MTPTRSPLRVLISLPPTIRYTCRATLQLVQDVVTDCRDPGIPRRDRDLVIHARIACKGANNEVLRPTRERVVGTQRRAAEPLVAYRLVEQRWLRIVILMVGQKAKLGLPCLDHRRRRDCPVQIRAHLLWCIGCRKRSLRLPNE